ncbi:hypothetical protein F441_00656 [Phytophthora nicotianae CJ01A1]|uniref:Uncharacterized protein n=2 Tax=Phytophthora nicotianae TaxID=4792 RepID=W2XVN5_PHYNI|nr:hypothetical protein L916_00619 [Phytophthora nicotianae]ETP26736.1 hypothetical protein F441_00656 [Phytophthora nicotianae CJ01A1]
MSAKSGSASTEKEEGLEAIKSQTLAKSEMPRVELTEVSSRHSPETLKGRASQPAASGVASHDSARDVDSLRFPNQLAHLEAQQGANELEAARSKLADQVIELTTKGFAAPQAAVAVNSSAFFGGAGTGS